MYYIYAYIYTLFSLIVNVRIRIQASYPIAMVARRFMSLEP